MQLIVLTDNPEKEYEILCFNALRYYCEINNYDLMIRSDYGYDEDYEYIFYISNKCLILNMNIKLEKLINKRHILQTYSDDFDENIGNFIIIKNDMENLIILRKLDINDYHYSVIKNLNYLTINNEFKNINFKNPIFLNNIKNSFFFIYGNHEENDAYLSFNDVILEYLYNQIFSLVFYNKNYKDIEIDFNRYDYTTDIEVFNPNKEIAFITLYTPNIMNEGVQMEYNMKTYCERNGYTFYIHRITENNPILQKAYLLKKYINEHKYIIWLDSDMICFDMNYKIEPILNWNVSLYCFKDVEKYSNTGFLIFKNDDKSKIILDDWISNIELYKNNEILIDLIINKYLKNSYRDTNMEINVPISHLTKNTKFIHLKNIKGFNNLILLEYLNYLVFNIKYKNI